LGRASQGTTAPASDHIHLAGLRAESPGARQDVIDSILADLYAQFQS
jgi:hypothetical protein